MTAEVDTNGGTYTTTSAVYVQPNLRFGGNDALTQQSGVPFTVQLNYLGADPLPSYTINWDDGSSTTGTSRYITHSYTFDPSWPNPSYTSLENDRYYTLTMNEGGQSSTLYGLVSVYPNHGAGTLTPGAIPTVIEGQPVTLSATFVDTDFAPTYTPNANYYISWDQTHLHDARPASGYGPASASNIYSLAGTYTVAWGVGYQDMNSPIAGGNSQPFFTITQQQVVVQHATPTVSVTDTVDGSDGVSVAPHFTAAPGSAEAVATWTIDWGDGSSVNTQFQAAYHPYATPGNYTIHATANTNEGTYTATCTASIASPTISITDRNGAAYENGQVADYFVVTRSIYDSLPMNVSFTIGGNATPGEYKLTDASTSQILTNSVTIPAGQQFCTIMVTPLDDVAPHWTDTLGITLGTSANYAIDSSHPSASSDIVGGGLNAQLGDGSGNIILAGSSNGTQNLVPLVLTFPSNAKMKNGDVLTLKDLSDTEANVWTTPTPGPSDQPILGNVDGTYTSSMSWTYGTSTLPSTTLWVGGTGGSASMDDIYFTLTGSDANATNPPTHPTTEAATTQPATDVTVKIISKNNPNDNGQPGSLDVTGLQRGWLLGQMADLSAQVTGPANLTKGLKFQWSTEGNVLRAMQGDGTSQRTAIQLSADDRGSFSVPSNPGGPPQELPQAGHHTGTSLPELALFWARIADNGPDTDNVTLAVTGNGLNIQPVKTTFLTTLPKVSNELVVLGTPGLSSDGTQIGLFRVSPANPNVGAVFFEQVDMPDGFAGQGQWKFVQKISAATHDTVLKQGFHDPYNGQGFVLDGHDPYVGIDQWSTGSGRQNANDTPAVIANLQGETEALEAPYFRMFVMFQPPGAGSQWVAIREIDWNFNIQLENNLDGKGWHLHPGYTPGTNNPSFQIPSEVPQWEQAATETKLVPD